MRIALFNHHASAVGGIEVYLRRLIPLLLNAGHEVALLHRHPPEPAREPVAPKNMTVWSVAALGGERALASVCEWKPDVVYAHGVPPPGPLESLSEAAPVLYFAHAYSGVCISEGKHFKAPCPQPCDRVFGPACLLMFYPRRCGGLNPLTMLADYRRQRRALAWLRRAARIATHSARMREEFLRHGIPAGRVSEIPFLVPAGAPVSAAHKPPSPGQPPRLLFLGRMERGKGGEFLLRALPAVQPKLGRSLSVVFAGDGPERMRWEALAGDVRREKWLSIRFSGWVDDAQRATLLAETDLLVLPSVWPEPFGQTGVEAAWAGVPAVAFDVGGVRAWLTPGVNGQLAPGNPPTVNGLAEALEMTLRDPVELARLGEGARREAERFTPEQHLAALHELLAMTAAEPRTMSALRAAAS